MKLTYVTNARLPTEKAHGLQIMKTCEALAQAGYEVQLVAPQRRNHLRDDPFEYYQVERSFSIQRVPCIDIKGGRAAFLFQQLSFAIAVAFHLKGSKVPIFSRDEVVLRILHVFGYRRYIWESHTGAWNRAARFVARHAAHIVVISRGIRTFYEEHGIATERMNIIPSALDLEQFAHPESKESARRRLGIPQEARVALYIGRLDGWKGVQTLLEAAALMEDVQVVVIGEGVDIEALRAQYPRILFLGARPYNELADNQAAADVLVIPNTGSSKISAEFTSPLKLFAHMASGIPIVVSDLPSMREVVDEDSVLLVTPDDPEALAEGILSALRDQETSEKRASRAREMVGQYSWDARAARISALLSRME